MRRSRAWGEIDGLEGVVGSVKAVLGRKEVVKGLLVSGEMTREAAAGGEGGVGASEEGCELL